MTIPQRSRVALRIRRQETAASMPFWEVFEVPLAPRLTIAEALDRLALQPFNIRRERVAPIAYTWGCASPGCVACFVVAGGRFRAACETLVEEALDASGVLTLEPMEKHGVIRDLLVNRERLREARAHLRAWGEPDAARSGSADSGTVPLATLLSACTRCGACVEACPETRTEGGFVGAAAVLASQLADARDRGDAAEPRRARHLALAATGGIHECGDARACLAACPVELPLDDVLGRAKKDAFAHAFRRR